MIIQPQHILICNRYMIQLAASQKMSGKDVSSVFSHQRAQISCIGKALERNPAAFWKSGDYIRIQRPQKLDAVSDLSFGHLEFITFPSFCDNHKTAGTDLFLYAALYSFPALVNPQDISAGKVVCHHMF